jgi:hypothetical protein
MRSDEHESEADLTAGHSSVLNANDGTDNWRKKVIEKKAQQQGSASPFVVPLHVTTRPACR